MIRCPKCQRWRKSRRRRCSECERLYNQAYYDTHYRPARRRTDMTTGKVSGKFPRG